MAKPTKAELVEKIIEDIQENFYDSRKFLLDLAREALLRWKKEWLLKYVDPDYEA